MAIELSRSEGSAPNALTGKGWLSLLVGAIFLGGLLVFGTTTIEKHYLKTNPFFFDPVGYISVAQDLGDEVEERGRWAVAGDELEDGLFPGYTVPLILLAPAQLGFQTPHTLVILPMIIVGLFLIGAVVARLWRDTISGWAAMLLSLAVPGYWYPETGLGTFWLDLPAGFLGAGAVATLLLWMISGRRLWLVIFGILAGWLVTCRYVAAAYLLVTGGPVVAFALWQRARKGIAWGRLAMDVGILAGSVAVFALPFLVWRMESMLLHYGTKSFGYQGVWASVVFTYDAFIGFLGWPFFLVSLGFGVAAAFASGHRGKGLLARITMPFWVANATLLFLGLTTQIGVAWHAVQFQAPLWVLGLFLVAPPAGYQPGLGRIRIDRPELFLRVSVRSTAIMVALVFAILAAWQSWRLGAVTQLENVARFELNQDLALEIQELPADAVVGLFYENLDIEGHRLNVEMRHRAKRDVLLAQQLPLYHLQSIWEAEYPGETVESLTKRYLTELDQGVDVAMVYSDPEDVDEVRFCEFALFANPYSHGIAKAVAAHVAASPDWVEVGRIPTDLYQSISLYRNLRRQTTDE